MADPTGGPCIYRFDWDFARTWVLLTDNGCANCAPADQLNGGKMVEPGPGQPDEIAVVCGSTEIPIIPAALMNSPDLSSYGNVQVLHRRPLKDEAPQS